MFKINDKHLLRIGKYLEDIYDFKILDKYYNRYEMELTNEEKKIFAARYICLRELQNK